MSTIAKLPTWWKQFIQNVCELDGRDSPEDEPDAMIATDAELQDAALRAIATELEAAPAADAAPVVAQWTWYSDEDGSWELRGPDYGSLAQGTEVRLITEAYHLSAIAALQAQIAELEAKLNTPELHDFSAAVVLEAAHQRERWGASHDVGKQPADWFWLLGYLGGKALNAAASGNTDKALHHTISTAAACANWHAAISGRHTQMRPGIDPVARGIEAAPSNPTTQPPEER